MAVPKQRHTKSKRNKRRMHIFLKQVSFVVCPKCKKPVRPHTVCKNCGTYKSREVIDVLKKLSKKEKKQKEKEIAAKETKEGKGAGKKSLSWEQMSRK